MLGLFVTEKISVKQILFALHHLSIFRSLHILKSQYGFDFPLFRKLSNS